MDEAKVLTTLEVSRILGVTKASVSLWLKDGHFPNAFKVNPRKRFSAWRVPQADVDAFIEERRRQRRVMYLPPSTSQHL